jgi:hypothetical protein
VRKVPISLQPLKNRGVNMVTKNPIDEGSVPRSSLSEAETQDSKLEGKVPPEENYLITNKTVNKEPFKFELCGNMHLDDQEKNHITGAPVIEVINVKKSYTLERWRFRFFTI